MATPLFWSGCAFVTSSFCSASILIAQRGTMPRFPEPWHRA